MIWLFILPILASSLDMNYMYFNPTSNPTSRQVNMSVLTSPTDTSYGVEIWVRPEAAQIDTGSFRMLAITNDWTVWYLKDVKAIQVLSQSNYEFCTMTGILPNVWTHLAFTFDITNGRTFTCYKNATMAFKMASAPTVSKSPDVVRIGDNYVGSYYELKVWTGYAPTELEIRRNFTNYFIKPYNPLLRRYYRLVLESYNATFLDYVTTASVSISSIYYKNLWIKEVPGSLILCAPGQYSLNADCANCPSTCSYCKSPQINNCYATARSFINLQRLPDTTSLKFAYPATTLTIEFWFYPFEWTTNLEIFSIGGYLRIAQRGIEPVVSFYDGNNNELYNFPAQAKNWVHVAFVSQPNSRADLYVNFSSVNVGWSTKTIDQFFFIASNSTKRFRGYVSDLRLWSTRKTAIDITGNMLINYTVRPTDLPVYCPLNDTATRINCQASAFTLAALPSYIDKQDCTVSNCNFWCPAKSYLNPSTGECSNCHPSCQACSGATSADCTVCPINTFTIPGNSSCFSACPKDYVTQGSVCQSTCSSGFYNNSFVCTKCPSYCTTCSNSTYCTSCPDGYSVVTQKASENCIANCGEAKFANPSNNYACESCSTNCKTCFNAAGTCTSCATDWFLYNSACSATCTGSKYAVDKNCFDCYESCETCTGPGTLCTKCKASYAYTDATGVCYKVCPSFFDDTNKKCLSACPVKTYASASNKCEACHESCSECTGPLATECATCPNKFYYNTCLAECPSFTYDNSSVCTNCSSVCKTCSGSSTDCTSCSGDYPYFYGFSCYAACPSNTFTLDVFKTCYETCPKGYFVDKSFCLPCDNTCSTCESSSSKCTSCPDDSFLYNSTCLKVCPAGLYPDQGICETCASHCKTCSQKSFCTSCTDPLLFTDPSIGTCNVTCNTTTYVLNKTCLGACPRSYYPSENPKLCQQCPEGCLDCTSNTICQTCSPNYYFLENTCSTECPKNNFYADKESMLCRRCDSNCLQCTGSMLSNCTLCTNGKFVYINANGVGNCVSICPEGTYLNNGMCLACLSTCKSCINNSTCQTCQKGYYYLSDKTCSSACKPGDLVNMISTSCTSYSSLSPIGAIDLSSFSLIQITYPVPVSFGRGSLSIFSVSNTTYTLVTTIFFSSGSTVSLGSSIATSVSSSIFSYSTNYSIEYNALGVSSSLGNNLQIPRGIWNFRINEYILQKLVVIINKGIKGIEVKKGESLTLNASMSYDPSAEYFDSVLSQNWSCYDFSQSYAAFTKNNIQSWADYVNSVSTIDPLQGACEFWDYLNPPDSYILKLSQFNDNDRVFRFTFTLSDNQLRSATKDVFIRVVPSSFNILTLNNLPVFKVNIDKDLQIFVDDPQLGTNSIYKWTCLTKGKSPTYLTPLNSWVLSIAADSMSANFEYTFSLTYSDINTKSSAVITVNTNSPPSSGTIGADKTEGTALIDTFTVQMIGWVDEDLPLTYSFMLYTNYSESGYFITSQQSASVLSLVVGSGSLTITGFCYDSLGSRSSASISFTVSPLKNIQKILELLDSLPASVDDSTVFESLSLVQAYATELNFTHPDTQVVISEKTKLFQKITECKKIADNVFGRGQTSQAAFMYAGILTCAQDLIREPVNADLANSVLDTVNSIDYKRLVNNPYIYPVSNTSINAQSPQGLFRRNEVQDMALSMSNLITLASEVEGSVNLGSISALVNTLASVFSIGSVVTEASRTVKIPSMSYISQKLLVSKLENTVVNVDYGVTVSVPSGLQEKLSKNQVQFFAVLVNNNPFDSTSTSTLDQYLTVELRDVDTQEVFAITNLNQSFVFSFNVSRSTLQTVQSQSVSKFGPSKILPECSYWSPSDSTWKIDGCSLSNIGDIYTYFEYQNIPDTFPILCSCNHLSQFSVNFYTTQQFATTSFLIKSEESESFSTNQWECSLVFYILLSGLITLVVGLSLAYYWDNYNPGLASPSIETEKTFRYWDPNRVETVLSELQKDFINQLSDSGNGSKKDTVASVAQILNSGLVNKLMSRNYREKKDDREFSKKKTALHPVEILMKADSDDESIQARTKLHLKKGLSDPRFIPTLVSEPKGRQNSKKDLENTKAQLKIYLNHLETNTQLKSPVDLFLGKFDDSEKLPQSLKTKLKLDKKELKTTDLQALGIHPDEFKALKVYKNGEIAADSTKLTNGKYCKFYLAEKIIEDAKRLHGSLKLPYWSLVWLYIRKEHKYISLLFNLHIEYSKKQMLILASVFWYQQLLFCHMFIAYLNWEWSREYNQSGLCVWGCNYESQMLAGVICAMLPWPLYYLCKYLFARNATEESGEFALK